MKFNKILHIANDIYNLDKESAYNTKSDEAKAKFKMRANIGLLLKD